MGTPRRGVADVLPVLSLAIRPPLPRDSPELAEEENPGRGGSLRVEKAPARYAKLDSFPAEHAPMIGNLEAAAFAGREELQTNGPPAKVSRWRQSPQERKCTVVAMWNPNRTQVPALDSERFMPDPQITQPSVRLALVSASQSTISKGLSFSGDITGTESIFIEGKVEGSINLPGNCVTVGHSGQVNAGISAGEIVVRGRIRGDVSAFTRVEIHADGALTGDVTATRISIEDGAFFKGGIDIRKPERKPERKADRKFPPESESEIELVPETQKTLLL